MLTWIIHATGVVWKCSFYFYFSGNVMNLCTEMQHGFFFFFFFWSSHIIEFYKLFIIHCFINSSVFGLSNISREKSNQSCGTLWNCTQIKTCSSRWFPTTALMEVFRYVAQIGKLWSRALIQGLPQNCHW